MRRLVAISMIITLVGMNALILLGLFGPKDEITSVGIGLTNKLGPAAPTIAISVEPTEIPAGSVASIRWSTGNNPTSCEASGDWTGPKTPEGSESTGKKTQQANYNYILSCQNEGGTAQASAALVVSPAGSSTSTASSGGGGSTSTPSPAPAPPATYCGGRSPCFSAKEVASHGTKGNCYGWNGDLVFNVSSLDEQYHKSLTGIPSVETSTICGKDLGPALRGQIGVPGAEAHNHKSTSINNTQANLLSFQVGYYDPKKP